MSDVRVTSSLFSFVIDFQVYGYDTTNLFTTVSGSPSISSNLLRLTSAVTRTKGQYLFGEYVFRMTIPVAPTAGQARSWGLKGVAVGNRGSIQFDVTETVFSVLAYDNAGTLIGQETIPWDADWTATATDYRIAWSESGVTFRVVGSTSAHVAIANIQFGTKVVNTPNPIFMSNGTADNVDVTYIKLTNVGGVESLAEAASGGAAAIITSITPGTAASNLGKAEDAAHASGDVGVEMLGVRNDAMTALAGTNGDYTPIATDQYGGLQIAQPTVFTAVTISDSTDLTALATKGIFCSVPLGVTTTLALRLLGASSTTVTVVLYSSQYLPGMFTRVMSAGTTLNGATVTAFS